MRKFVVAAAMLALAGCYQVPQSTKASYESGTLNVSLQAAGPSILVASAGLPSNGWIVVHEVQDGKPVVTGSIGHAWVSAGPSENISVPVSGVASGDQVVVMLHLDTGAPKIFEFANGNVENLDPPVVNEGNPVMTMITLN